MPSPPQTTKYRLRLKCPSIAREVLPQITTLFVVNSPQIRLLRVIGISDRIQPDVMNYGPEGVATAMWERPRACSFAQAKNSPPQEIQTTSEQATPRLNHNKKVVWRGACSWALKKVLVVSAWTMRTWESSTVGRIPTLQVGKELRFLTVGHLRPNKRDILWKLYFSWMRHLENNRNKMQINQRINQTRCTSTICKVKNPFAWILWSCRPLRCSSEFGLMFAASVEARSGRDCSIPNMWHPNHLRFFSRSRFAVFFAPKWIVSLPSLDCHIRSSFFSAGSLFTANFFPRSAAKGHRGGARVGEDSEVSSDASLVDISERRHFHLFLKKMEEIQTNLPFSGWMG